MNLDYIFSRSPFYVSCTINHIKISIGIHISVRWNEMDPAIFALARISDGGNQELLITPELHQQKTRLYYTMWPSVYRQCGYKQLNKSCVWSRNTEKQQDERKSFGAKVNQNRGDISGTRSALPCLPVSLPDTDHTTTWYCCCWWSTDQALTTKVDFKHSQNEG